MHAQTLVAKAAVKGPVLHGSYSEKSSSGLGRIAIRKGWGSVRSSVSSDTLNDYFLTKQLGQYINQMPVQLDNSLHH